MVRFANLTVATLVLLSVVNVGTSAQSTHEVELMPLAELYGAGYVQSQTDPNEGQSWDKYDGQVDVRLGSSVIGHTSRRWRAWVVFDVSSLPSTLDVQALSLRMVVLGADEDLQWVQYRRLTQDPRSLEAEACWDVFFNYVYVESGPSEAWTEVLGDSANADLENAVKSSGLFMIGITADEELHNGRLRLAGWGQGLPSLTVAYEDSTVTPVKPATWGRVKGQYGK